MIVLCHVKRHVLESNSVIIIIPQLSRHFLANDTVLKTSPQLVNDTAQSLKNDTVPIIG